MTPSDAIIGFVDADGNATVQDYWLTAYRVCDEGRGKTRTYDLLFTDS